MKKDYITVEGYGSSFNFPSVLIDEAIRRLAKLKILSIGSEGSGFANAEITSFINP